MRTREPAIILVEEDKLTLELYSRELSKSFMVLGFTEIADVLGTIENQQDIQAVVIEPEIQSGQGWELIRSIQERLPRRNIPVIVCSTSDSNKQIMDRGLTDYLTKPVLPSALREKTISAIEKLNRSK